MAGVAQRGCAAHDARGGPSGSGHSSRARPVRRDTVRGASFGMEFTPVNVRDASEIERAVMAFARASNGGLIVTASPLATLHRDLIITLAVRHKLPAVYPVASSSPTAA